MGLENKEITSIIIPWGTHCYKVIPFGLKNPGATYRRAMAMLFYDIIHREKKVYVDGLIIKSMTE